MGVPFWQQFVGNTVVVEYGAWTGQVRFLGYHMAGPGTPAWLELQTLSGHTAFVRSTLIDVIRAETTEDIVGEYGLAFVTLAGMRSDERPYAEPPLEDGGDREPSDVMM